ncbi:DNA-processing protein DprA, partial [Acinetobacter baumannii]|uniref:DNA-processing protein DprA n=1 Tax=Acinetobacter baumannii TaxID=470 RepID=UPI0024B6E9A4
YDFAYYVSEKGFINSSGLTYGNDEAAHQVASTHQRTIAVTGTGLDTTYPAQNKKLAEHILAQNGYIITEFLPGTPPLQQHYPRKNRIVSGM